MTQASMQIGKNGITDNFISSLVNCFKNHDNIKVSVFKSACRDKKELKKITENILENLGKNYTARIVGYTIAFKKWKKSMR